MSIVFIWRGFGLIVPIIFFITAWIVSLFIDDTRLGNPSFIGWTCFYTAIVLLLPGIGMWGGAKEEDGTVKKHDFMFVPVLFWALGLGIISAVVFFSRDSEPEANTTQVVQEDETEQKEINYRTINFLNSGDDILKFVIANETGVIDRFKVSPKSWVTRDLEPHGYLFASYDLDGNTVVSYPDEKYANDKNKYEIKQDKEGKFYQRLVGEPTSDKNDYDAAWIILDSTHNLMMIDVTPMLPADFKKGNLKDIDWTKNVVALYDAKDMMEPSFPKDAGANPRMLEPGDLLPSSVPEGQHVYSILSVPAGQDITTEYLRERLGDLYFE